ncbi:kelch repeat-containing protein [Hippocampus comes]|uniref:kelch repeat-containing protein n=1 Tax=Hippocampus comes TaxID=109280 RepID=UPI00094E7652|nr:PREDICTED: uncharacterized protein LOC109511862 [Hippocampus comes]
MGEFGVFALFGLDASPQRLLGDEGSRLVSVAIPPKVQQVVLFSSGPWGERTCVNADLYDAHRTPITIGKLTPYNRCLSWEQWEEETWTNGATLTVTLEGGHMAKDSRPESALMLAVKDHTPKHAAAPLAPQELNCKKKRKRATAEELDMGKDARVVEEEVENMCPNSSLEQTTPSRKVQRHAKGRQKLFLGRGNAAKSQGAVLPSGPSGRWGQMLCPIDAQTAILIGGQGARMQFCKDPLWKLCTEDLSWVPAETLAQGPTPEARIGHTAVYDPDSDRIFVFGGSKNKKWFNDVHILDTQTWKWTMVEVRVNLEGGGGIPGLMEFSAVQTSGRSPAPRCWHGSAVISATKFLIHGGYNGNNSLRDAFVFDTETNTWTEVTLPQLSLARAGHSIVAMETASDRDAEAQQADKTLLVFGGGDNEGAFYADVTVVAVKEILALL